jgi:hypothetical protein
MRTIGLRHGGPLLTLAVAVGAFYAVQLMSDTASIQWDALEVHYSSQAFFSQQIRAGHLPFWTAYLFSGFPFLADPQVGAWYPLNWPFFLAGVTPRSIQYELALHTLIACAGAYVLAFRLVGDRTAAIAVALFYGLGGFFAAHSQHVGMFQTAAWLPWLLTAVQLLGERISGPRLALAGAVGASIVLAGHFQTALYCFAAAAALSVYEALRMPARWRRMAVGLTSIAALSFGLSAIQVLPGLELSGESIRTELDVFVLQQMFFRLPALITLVWPNYYGALFATYVGPVDLSQYYWYSGILLVPLAIIGCVFWPGRALAALLVIPFAWYAAGPAGGLYLLVARLPGFQAIQGPINVWFVPALGLALVAGGGLARLLRRYRWRLLPPLLLLLVIADLVFWNSLANRLAYDHSGPNTPYPTLVASLRERLSVLPGREATVRLHGDLLTRLGYLNSSLQVGAESTYGYNPLMLRRYRAYFEAAQRNPRLVDALAATYLVRAAAPGDATVEPNPNALPLAYLARRVVATSDSASEREALLRLDPAEQTLAAGPAMEEFDPTASIKVLERSQEEVLLHYRSASPALIHLAIPWFPGWRASAGSVDLRVLPVDHALLGVVVAPGESNLLVRYVPTYFWWGATISLLSLVVVVAAVALPVLADARGRRRTDRSSLSWQRQPAAVAPVAPSRPPQVRS